MAKENVPALSEISKEIKSLLEALTKGRLPKESHGPVSLSIDKFTQSQQAFFSPIIDQHYRKTQMSTEQQKKSAELSILSRGICEQVSSYVSCNLGKLAHKHESNRRNPVRPFGVPLGSILPETLPGSYNDASLYLRLLGERSGGEASLQAKISAKYSTKAAAGQLRDGKESKGRKIKYKVYDKLTNFMAPKTERSLERWSDAKCDEFYASLFGKRAEALQLRQN